MLVLANVGEDVIHRQPALAHPGFGIAQMAAPSMDPRDLRRDRADERVVLAHEDPLSISQQGKGAVAVADSQAKLCLGHPRR